MSGDDAEIGIKLVLQHGEGQVPAIIIERAFCDPRGTFVRSYAREERA